MLDNQFTVYIFSPTQAMASSLTHLLSNWTKQYQTSVHTCETLSQALTEQQLIKKTRKIPSKYVPKVIFAITPASTSDFLEKYHNIFFDHLEETIQHNTIELKSQQALQQKILTLAEKELALSNTDTKTIHSQYREFLRQNNINDRIAIPELQYRLGRCEASPKLSIGVQRRARKKRLNQSNESGIHDKRPRVDSPQPSSSRDPTGHFLLEGLRPPADPD